MGQRPGFGPWRLILLSA